MLAKGERVVRGPDWSWGEQDGGEGHVGTVTSVVVGAGAGGELRGCPRWAIVQWDGADRRYKYRCGAEDKYDLRLFDSGPAGVKHLNSVCGSCHTDDIIGTLWRCVCCHNYYLCSSCYCSGRHCLEHDFIRIDTPGDDRGVRIPVRLNAEVVVAQGIFTGAEVTRGYNWKWGDQDGCPGNCGTVTDVTGWKNESFRSVVTVQWSHNRKRNVYRVGHRAKVDVTCVRSTSGGSYYPQHLLSLGAYYQSKHDDQLLKAGDFVKTELDPDVFKMLQDGHGGWNDHMASVIGSIGQVCSVNCSGDLRIKFSNVGMFLVNSASVTKTHLPQFSSGDRVKVIADGAKLRELQEGHGGWLDGMVTALGEVGVIVRVLTYDCVDVFVAGCYWTLNVLCLSQADDSALDHYRASLLENLALSPPSRIVPAATLLGETAALRAALETHPYEVDAEMNHRTAVHLAIGEGNIDALKVILQYKPNLEAETGVGDKPLHLAAYCDQPAAIQLLLEAGAIVNSRNKHSMTPVMVAARCGNRRALKAFLDHPEADIALQDPEGYTAFHSAFLGQHTECMAVLLGAGADPTMLNYHCFSALSDAARGGFYQGVCNVNAADAQSVTPLHGVTYEGHSRGLEMLLAHGALPNVQDFAGNTPLLGVLQGKKIKAPSNDCPRTKKIYEDLIATYGSDKIEPYMASACLLMQYGADIHIKNKSGMSPLKVTSPDVVNILMSHQPSSSAGSLPSDDVTVSNPGTDSSQRSDLNQVTVPEAVASPSEVDVLPSHQQPASGSGSEQMTASNEDSELTPDHSAVIATTDENQVTPDPSPMVARLQDTADSATGEGVEGEGEGEGEEDELCALCDQLADVRFEPCGDVILCQSCSDAAKKCPKCQGSIQSRVLVLPVTDEK